MLGDGLLIVNATAEDSQHQYICQAMNLETGTFKTVEISLIINRKYRFNWNRFSTITLLIIVDK